MTIQDLGSIGELVAAMATVATLIYLALQIRANTKALRIEARRSESEIAGGYADPIIGSSEVARIFNAGLADPTSLPPEEATRFSFLIGRIIGAESNAFDEVRSGFMSTEHLERKKRNLIRFIATPGGRWFWSRFAEDFPAEFRSYVDRILVDAGSAA